MASLDQYQSYSQVEDTLQLLLDSNSKLQLEVEQLKRENCELKQQLQCKVECGGVSDQKPAEILKIDDEDGNEDLQNKVEPLDSKGSPKEGLQKEIEMMTHRFETVEKTEADKMTIWEIFKKEITEISRLEDLVREKEGCVENLESERGQVLNLMRELRVSSEFPEIEGFPFLEQLEKVVVHIKKKLCEYRGICKFLHEKLLNRASRGSTKRTAQTSSHEAISVSTQTSQRIRFSAPPSSSVFQNSSSNLSQLSGPHTGPSPAVTPSTSVTSGINVQDTGEIQTTMQHPPTNSRGIKRLPNPPENLTMRIGKTREGQGLGKGVWKVKLLKFFQVVQVGTSHAPPEPPSGLIPSPGTTVGVIDESQSNDSLTPVSPRGGDQESVDPIRRPSPPPGQSEFSASESSVSPEGIKMINCLGTMDMDTNESNHILSLAKDEEVDMETTATDTFISPHPPQTPLPTVHPSTSTFGSEPVLNEMITRHAPPNLPTTQLNHQEVAHRTSLELPSTSGKFMCQFCGNEFRSKENPSDHGCPSRHSSKQLNQTSTEDEDDEDVVILPPPSSPIIANEGVHNDDVEIIDLTADLESPPPFIPERNDDLSNKSVKMETDTDNQEISIVQSSSSEDPNKTIFHAPFLVVQTLKTEDEEVDVETDTSPAQDQFTEAQARDGKDSTMTPNSTATAHGYNSPEPEANLPVTNDNASANLGPTTEPPPPQPFPSTSQPSSQTPVGRRRLHGVDSKKKNTCICKVVYGNKELLQSHIKQRSRK